MQRIIKMLDYRTAGIDYVLKSYFSKVAKDRVFRSDYNKILDIINFSYTLARVSNAKFDKESRSARQLKVNLKRITAVLHRVAKEKNSDKLGEEYAWATYFLTLIDEEPERLTLGNLYSVIVSNFDYIKEMDETYKLLSAICSMQRDYVHTIETEEELKQLIIDATPAKRG